MGGDDQQYRDAAQAMYIALKLVVTIGIARLHCRDCARAASRETNACERAGGSAETFLALRAVRIALGREELVEELVRHRVSAGVDLGAPQQVE